MKILSVDTSNKIASVSIFEDNNFLGEKFSNDQKTHSEKLLPLIDELLKEFELEISDIDLFIVSVGPGSFTGIRIGVSTIKGIAQALNKKVISVTSLEGLIEMANSSNVCAMINARHENIYYQIKYNGVLKEADCKNINEIIDELKELNEKFVIVGDATIEFEKILGEKLNCEIFEKKIQGSSDIAKFGLNKYFSDNKNAKKPSEIIPFYLRKAQPDREV